MAEVYLCACASLKSIITEPSVEVLRLKNKNTRTIIKNTFNSEKYIRQSDKNALFSEVWVDINKFAKIRWCLVRITRVHQQRAWYGYGGWRERIKSAVGARDVSLEDGVLVIPFSKKTL